MNPTPKQLPAIVRLSTLAQTLNQDLPTFRRLVSALQSSHPKTRILFQFNPSPKAPLLVDLPNLKQVEPRIFAHMFLSSDEFRALDERVSKTEARLDELEDA